MCVCVNISVRVSMCVLSSAPRSVEKEGDAKHTPDVERLRSVEHGAPVTAAEVCEGMR